MPTLREVLSVDCTHIGFAPVVGFSPVLKSNIWRDAAGKYTSKEKAVYQGTVVYDHASTLAKHIDAHYAKGSNLHESMNSPEGKTLIKGLGQAYTKYSAHTIAGGGTPSTLAHHIGNHIDYTAAGIISNKVQASMNSAKAWKKIYQKKSLDALESEYPKLVAEMNAASGKAKEKAFQKLEKKAKFWEDQYVSNGGDIEDFTNAQIMAYNKGVFGGLLQPETGLSNSKVKDSGSKVSAPKPSWSDPSSVAGAKAMNHALGIHYYKTVAQGGLSDPETINAYSEWNKSKVWLAANSPGHDPSAASLKSKKEAQLQIDAVATSEKDKTNAKAKVLSDLTDHAYALSYAKAQHGESSSQYHSAKSFYDNSVLLAADHGYSDGMVKKYSNTGEVKAKAAHAQAESFKKLLSGTTKDTIKYYDDHGDDFKQYNHGSEPDGYAAIVSAKIKSLTSDQRSAIKNYAGSGYTGQNKSLVKGSPTGLAQDMAEALKGSTLGVDMYLRRNAPQKWFWKALGISEEDMNDQTPDQLSKFIGKTYTEPAFSSTSKDLGFSSAFSGTSSLSGAIQLNIRAHKGIRGLDISHYVSNYNEDEVVLDKGVTYVIRSVKKHSSSGSSKYKYVAEVDAIGHKD